MTHSSTTARTPSFRLKPFDVIRFVLHRGPLILILGMLIFVLFLPLLLSQVSPGYRAETFLMVTPLKQPTLQGRERDVIPGDLKDYMRTLTQRITSYNIVQEALTQLPSAEWPSFLKSDDSIARNIFRVMRRIEAREIPGTYLLEVSLEAASPDELGPLLNAVSSAFLSRLEKEQEQQYARRLQYLSEERTNIISRINVQRARLINLSEQAGQKAFLHQAYDAHLAKLNLLQNYFWQAEARRVEDQAALDKARLQRANISKLSLQPFAEQEVADNFGINRMEQWTYEKLQELRSSIDGLTPSNHERQYVEMRMEALQEYLTVYKSEVRTNTLIRLKDLELYELDKNLVTAESTSQSAAIAVDYLNTQLSQARIEASRISEIIFNAQEIMFHIEQLQSRLAALDSRIDDNQIQAKAPLPVHIDRKAFSPENPFETNKSKMILFAFVLAFGFVGALCLFFDLLDARIRSRHEIEKAVGGAIPTSVPLIDPLQTEDAFAFIQANSNHPAAQAIRALAVRLMPEKKQRNSTVFCIASTQPCAGTSTCAAALAASLAAFDERVLLIELNTTDPSPRLSALNARLSSVDLLSGNAGDLHDAVVPFPGASFDALPSAACAANSLPISHLVDLLQEARKHYAWVLLDCAPLLDYECTQFAAQQADATLLIVREDESIYADLCDAIALLRHYHVPALSVLLNGARPPSGRWLPQTIQTTLSFITTLHRQISRHSHTLKKWITKK